MGNFWPLLPGVRGNATFPLPDHRISLERNWSDDPHAGFVLHIGMNPSMAGADRDDLTVRKDQEFTRRMGFSRMFKFNLGTLVSTDPEGLCATGAVVCVPNNLEVTIEHARRASRIVVATGKPPGPLVPMANNLFRSLRGLRVECFGLTRDHWPKHSSRLAYATPLVEFVW